MRTIAGLVVAMLVGLIAVAGAQQPAQLGPGPMGSGMEMMMGMMQQMGGMMAGMADGTRDDGGHVEDDGVDGRDAEGYVGDDEDATVAQWFPLEREG